MTMHQFVLGGWGFAIRCGGRSCVFGSCLYPLFHGFWRNWMSYIETGHMWQNMDTENHWNSLLTGNTGDLRQNKTNITSHWGLKLMDSEHGSKHVVQSTRFGVKPAVLEFQTPTLLGRRAHLYGNWRFPEIGVTRIIHFYGIFRYKPSLLGCPHLRKPPAGTSHHLA